MTTLIIGTLCVCLTACTFFSIWLAKKIDKIELELAIISDYIMRSKHEVRA